MVLAIWLLSVNKQPLYVATVLKVMIQKGVKIKKNCVIYNNSKHVTRQVDTANTVFSTGCPSLMGIKYIIESKTDYGF